MYSSGCTIGILDGRKTDDDIIHDGILSLQISIFWHSAATRVHRRPSTRWSTLQSVNTFNDMLHSMHRQ